IEIVVADAARQGVIRAQSNTLYRPPLQCHAETVVIGRTAGFHSVHRTKSSGDACRDTTVERQFPALVVTCSRGGRTRRSNGYREIDGLSVEEATSLRITRTRNVDNRVDRLRCPEMTGGIAEVACRNHP